RQRDRLARRAQRRREPARPDAPGGRVSARVPTPGERVGRWTLGQPLGRGAMGVVFRARDDAGTEAALKLLAPELARDRKLVARFHTEAKAAASVRHANLVRGLDAGSDRGLEFIAFELVPGGSLAQKITLAG